MAKLKCASCGLYSDAESSIRVGIQSYCAPACRWTKVKNRSKPRKRSSGTDQKTRRRVRDRDQTCRFCGTYKDLHVHHIVYRSQGGSDDPTNLITLCAEHHAVVHSDKKRFAPLCLGVVWLTYQGQRYSVPGLERAIRAESISL